MEVHSLKATWNAISRCSGRTTCSHMTYIVFLTEKNRYPISSNSDLILHRLQMEKDLYSKQACIRSRISFLILNVWQKQLVIFCYKMHFSWKSHCKFNTNSKFPLTASAQKPSRAFVYRNSLFLSRAFAVKHLQTYHATTARIKLWQLRHN